MTATFTDYVAQKDAQNTIQLNVTKYSMMLCDALQQSHQRQYPYGRNYSYALISGRKYHKVMQCVDGQTESVHWTIEAELASGIKQHLDDDHWFHSTQGFLEISTDMSILFRQIFTHDETARVGFLGHIVTELLLDRVLIEQNPGLIDEYYAAFSEIDPLQTEIATNKMTTKETDKLKLWLAQFSKEAFLRDYLDSQRMLVRLNQVMNRVKLQPLPVETISVLNTGRKIVEKRLNDLLPPEHF